MPKRLKDWPSRLDATVRAAKAQPFAWGSRDCCLWAADAVLACTGHDPAAQWRGTYSAALGAMRLVDELGGLAAIGAMAGPEIPPNRATTGDVGLIQGITGREMLGVYSGQAWLVLAETVGFVTCPRGPRVLRAWKVGG